MAEIRSALIIASEAFADPGLPRLPRVVVNASAFADVLEDPGIGDFDVRTLVNQPVQAIRARVTEFLAGHGPGDLLLVYYAGYGIRDDRGELYLAAADTVPGRLEATAVPAEFVSRQIGFSGSRQVMLMLDCAERVTFSGNLVAKGYGGPGIEQEFGGPGRMVIAASGGPGYAALGPAFTVAMVEGLETGAANRGGGGLVGVDDLYDYAARRVRELPASQVPSLGAVDLREGLYIARGGGRPSSFGPPRGRQSRPESDVPTRGLHRGTGSPPPFGDGVGPGVGVALESLTTEPAALFWNTRFPRDQGILLNRPHLVVAGAEYRLETGLGPRAEPDAMSSPQQAARLLGRQIRYRLEAENGEFRRPDSAQWQITAESAAMTCTAAGTDAFAVFYRAREAGPAIIRALLIVDNGSVDQQQIKLTAVAGDEEAETVPRSSVAGSPARPVGRSVAGAPSPDYRLSIWKYFADLSHHNTRVGEVKLQPELADQLKEVATAQYSELRDVSLQHPLQAGGGLRVADSGEAKLRLAKAGAELHRRLFREPVREITGGLPAKLGAMADYLRDTGDAADPPLLQIITHDFPLPWGLLYDRSSDGGEDLKAPEDVDEAGFWGRRFDIYRSVVSVDRDTRRGRRRWVKPVIGFDVPRNQEQQDYVDELRADLSDVLLRVEDTVSTVPDLRDWATGGGDSDLIYLFCHTRPARYGKPGNWLGLGQAEDEERVGLDDLEQWWGKPRLTNPIVILNACSSGQQDTIYGAPFVEFFMDKWGAQAFIGTDWPINASFADVFGRRLLREILVNRHSLRDAFRVVSDEAAAADNFFPLMYAIYGLNTVQFTDPLSA
jgi:hypothetical protein